MPTSYEAAPVQDVAPTAQLPILYRAQESGGASIVPPGSTTTAHPITG